jgi:hypothetical protein
MILQEIGLSSVVSIGMFGAPTAIHFMFDELIVENV